MSNRYKIISILFIFFLTIHCLAPKDELPVYSQEIARVDNLIIKEDVLRFRLGLEMSQYPENYFADKTNPDIMAEQKGLVEDILQKIVLDYSIIAYGKKKKILATPAELEQAVEEKKRMMNPKTFEILLEEKNIPFSRWKQMIEDETLVQKIMNADMGRDIKVTSAEIQAYYNTHAQEFDVPERVRVRQIVTDSLKKADDIYSRLLKGENFAKLAVDHSLSPDRSKGGDLGYFARGTMPKEFDEYCFKLKKGETSPVVKSDYGYHIFKLLDKKPAGRKSLTEVVEQINQLLFEQKLAKKYESWIKDVQSKVTIVVHQDVIDRLVL